MNKPEDISKKGILNISGLITITFSTVILGICILIIRSFFYRPWWSEYVVRNLELLFGIICVITAYLIVKRIYRLKRFYTLGIIILFLFFQYSLYFSINPYQNPNHYGLIMISSRACLVCLLLFPILNAMNRWVYGIRGSLKNDILAYSGIIIGLFLFGIWLNETRGAYQTFIGMGCGIPLQKLDKALSIYSDDNQGKYPDPDQWCDILVNNKLAKNVDFICPEVKFRWERQILPLPIPINRKSYYAINPNCEPNSPPDTVLLFDIKGGWNKSGGPELLTTENHQGNVCIVLFNDGHIETINSQEIANLKWE